MEPTTKSRSVWLAALVVFIVGLIVNIALAALLHPLAPSLMQLSVAPVAAWTLLGTIGASVVFAFMRRKPQNLSRRFLTVAGIVLIVSFIPDILIHFVQIPGFTGATIGGVLSLMLLHVTTAVVAVSVLLKLAGPRN